MNRRSFGSVVFWFEAAGRDIVRTHLVPTKLQENFESVTNQLDEWSPAAVIGDDRGLRYSLDVLLDEAGKTIGYLLYIHRKRGFSRKEVEKWERKGKDLPSGVIRGFAPYETGDLLLDEALLDSVWSPGSWSKLLSES